MATLEVHDDRGRIRRVELDHNHPVLFGSSPKCDIVLAGEGVFPFHGRIRWKTKRYKADASPDSQYLLINGHKMAASSFRQGDQIRIGRCRIVMLYGDESAPHQDDKTRVQAAPVARRRNRLEDDDWVADLEPAGAPREKAVAAPGRREEAARRGGKAEPPAKKKRVSARGGGFWSVLTTGDRPPGQERLVSSPLVIGLVIAFVALVVLSLFLKGIIDQTVATRQFHRAVENFDDGDYRNALRRFEEFATAHPKDERASKARVLHALANVRQFTTSAAPSWTNALEAERAMFETVAAESAYRDSSTDLADEVVKTGEALADRARLSADGKTLAEAEAAAALHALVAGPSAPALLARSRLPGKLAEARAAVRKAEVRARALARMDAALKAKSSARVYQARDALVRRYADLADDPELIDRMTRANDLIRLAVTFDPSRRPAETEPRRDPLRPPLSLVLRASAPEKETAVPARPATVFALAEGFAYGIEGRTGTPLWHVAVGLSAPFAPQPLPGGTSALVFDSRADELTRIDARTGTMVWRQATDEPIDDPPLVLGNQIIQPTRSGKVLLIDLKSGERQGTVNLGLPATRTPVSDEAGQFLYLLAEKDCLFVLRRDPAECVAVEYLGHRAGSIPCPPTRLGRFLVVAENHTLDQGRWRVLLLDADGTRARPIQQVPLTGWVWGTPAASGSVIWADDDRAGLAAFAVGSYDEKNPFRAISRHNAETQSSGPTFALARSERELWVASGHPGRYELDAEKGGLKRAWSLVDAGPALGPVQVSGALMVLTQQETGGPGVALWGVEPKSGTVRWRTVLGTPWPVPLAETPDGAGLSALGGDGRPLAIARAQLVAGGFIEAPLPQPGHFRLPPGPLARLENDGVTVLVPGPDTGYLLARSGTGEFQRVDLPTPLGAAPLLWGRDVLLPGVDGRAYLMDPLSGESRAEPLVPAFDRAHPTRWKAPVRLEGDAVALADESGRVLRLTRVHEPRPRLVVSNEVKLDQEIVAGPASTGGAVFLATSDHRLRALAGRDLSAAGAWPLESPLAFAPAPVAGHVFIADKAGGILALGPEGQRLWSATLRNSAASGPPVLQGTVVWFLARDGSLQRFALADGAPLGGTDLGVLPVDGLRVLGPDLVVPVAPGTIRLLDPNSIAPGPTGK